MFDQETDSETIRCERAGYVLRIKPDDDGVTLRIDRKPGSGRPLYETMTLSNDELEWLLVTLMDLD